MTPALRSNIDRLWTDFWTGGITNPLTVIEQITYLIFLRLMDAAETRDEAIERRTGRGFTPRFGLDAQAIRWRTLRELGSSEELVRRLRDEAFPHLRTLGRSMADAQFMIPKPSLAKTAVELIDALPLTGGDDKGDIYEYLLGKLATAGINGQFRTPRHIIRFMADVLDIGPDDRVADPACGTGGFLVAALERVLATHSSVGSDYPTGDLLSPEQWAHLSGDFATGFDFDVTMLRIAEMNLRLHGLERPRIRYQDALSAGFVRGDNAALASDAFTAILANPPFKGSLDAADVSPDLNRTVKTRKTELLFVALILRMLRAGGRSATIVPDGVLFGSSGAHRALREHLVERHQLDGVISLPAGVFKPYAGVSTAILLFTKGGETRDVFFYDVTRDGFSLDDKRTRLADDQNDLPAALAAWCARGSTDLSDRTAPAFTVPAAELRTAGYDLSVGRWRERTHEEAVHEAPAAILARMKDRLRADLAEMDALAEMLA
ncbi:type I restriction-modification system subunit M [Sphingomonas sp. CFBP 13706]|uniref:type I restriction-modification system subunit M n=1 Tax=Sphingomonas sp. CFBP 13706 TaxID=2775314 RepID=UPI001783ECA6|nr:class I SAM-dependent DNA methyltransferase [Sphingomonas sp. CFBP 13706]MBD8736868.1 SAM-dependent DNA methyltransferase [Sphingomonas sp. CFBP 13706]